MASVEKSVRREMITTWTLNALFAIVGAYLGYEFNELVPDFFEETVADDVATMSVITAFLGRRYIASSVGEKVYQWSVRRP